jgi:hypothetical protein
MVMKPIVERVASGLQAPLDLITATDLHHRIAKMLGGRGLSVKEVLVMRDVLCSSSSIQTLLMEAEKNSGDPTPFVSSNLVYLNKLRGNENGQREFVQALASYLGPPMPREKARVMAIEIGKRR